VTGRVRGRSPSGYRVTLVLAILGLTCGAGCAGPTTPPSWREDATESILGGSPGRVDRVRPCCR